MTEYQVVATEQRLHEAWHAQPFVPFRLRLMDGSTLPIERPRDILVAPVGARRLVVALNDGTVQVMDTREVSAVEPENGAA